MAVNKKAQRAASTVRPDPAPFQALVDTGAAPYDVVLDAYELVLCRWTANGGVPEQIEVSQERPEIDREPTLDGLLVLRHRERQWAE